MIVNGICIPSEVKTYQETGFKFHKWRGAYPRKNKPVNKVVVHWTGSERTGPEGAASIYQNMSARRVGCHFAITNEGTIWQFNDPFVDATSHAGRAININSVGIEVSCIGITKSSKRPLYEGKVHGWKTTFADFYPAQYDSLIWLCRTLVDHPDLEILPVVLSDPFEKCRPKDIRRFSGILGHAHCTTRTKPDPGPLVMRVLKEKIESR